MASPQKNGVNGAMAEQKESSVLFSLKELMNIEESRIREEEDAKKRRVEEETRARLDAERRAREEEEARLRAEEESRRQEELRRKMEEAQIEAAKHAEIEKARLAEQHRLQMEALAKQQAHERELTAIQSQKRAGIHPGVLGGLGALVLALIVAIVYFVSIVPKNKAKEALARAKTEADSNDEKQWDSADNDLAVAKANDPQNTQIAEIQSVLDKKRAEVDAARKAEAAAKEQMIADLQQKLAHASSPEEIAKLREELEAAKNAKPGAAKPVWTGTGTTAKPAAAKPCVCPPGVPLCNC